MTYNGKPSAKDLPEFDFDNLPDRVVMPEEPAQVTNPIQPQPPTIQKTLESIQSPVSTMADGNRSAPLFNADRKFDFQNHDWVQRGRELTCMTCPENHAHGTFLKADQQLTGSRGNWQIVANGGHCQAHGKPKMLCEECADLTVNANTPKE